MKPQNRKLFALGGFLCALLALLLTGCPPSSQGPKVTLVKEGGEQIGVSLSLAAGDSLALQAQSTSAADIFYWSSSAPDVAAVDGSGHVTAIAPGTVIITVTGSVSLASASIQLQVSPGASGEGEGEVAQEGEVPQEGEVTREGEVVIEGEVVKEGETTGEGEGQTVPGIVFTVNDNGSTASVPLNEEFAVRLASGYDGGYEWTVTAIDKSILENLSHTHDLSGCPADVEGCSGDEVFIFTSHTVGQTILSLEMRRSWEDATLPPAASFTIKIQVVAGSEGESGCVDEPVRMMPFSGRFGYGLAGAFGFTGSLTKQALTDPAWLLEGTFTFPTGGYAVALQEILIAESYPEQVSVTIVVTPPPPNVPVPQVITQASVTAEIAVANGATFKIRTLTCPPGEIGGEGEGEVGSEGEGEGEWTPQGEASWIPGDTGPAAWTVKPKAPTEADIIRFSGPSAVYQNLCHALVTAGQPQILMDPTSHRIRLAFAPVATFVACDDVRKPVAGVQGSFGPLEKGDWILYAESAADSLLSFNISLHVGAAVPGFDAHLKPIPDDSDGNYLTGAEEAALGIPQDDPIHSGGEVPAGVQMAHQLFEQIAQLPVCPGPVPMPLMDANGNTTTTPIPVIPPLCKTPVEANCMEKCSVCGEPCNCGFVAINGAGIVDPATGVTAQFQVSFAALHYMRHGSLSYGWKNDAYAGRVDVVALMRLFNPPPDPLSQLTGLFLKADSDGDGCLSLAELTTVVPAMDDKLFGLLQQLVECPYAGPLADGTDPSRPQLIDEICFCGNINATPELLKDILTVVLSAADTDGDQSISFAEAQAYMPSLTDGVFKFLDQNGDGVISAADIPSPPPPDPLSELTGLFLKADSDGDGCLSLAELKTVLPSMDDKLFALLQQLVECPYAGPLADGTDPSRPQRIDEICFCGNINATPELLKDILAAVLAAADTDGDQSLSFAEAQAYMPPLTDGIFKFLDQNGDGVINAADVPNPPPPPPPIDWIVNGQCPAQWTIDPPAPATGSPIHFSGPTPAFGSACEATSEMGTPRLSIDPSAQRIELLFDPLPGPMPCPLVYAPVCGLQGVLGPLKEGAWTLFCSNPKVTFDLSFTVQGAVPPPVDCAEAQWIPGESGPKDWTMEMLPLGAPVNGIRIAGPTPVFGNDCMGQAGLGGCPFVCRDDTARTLTLLFEGPPPEVCYQVYAPVCGLAAQIIGIANGTWTFSAPTLIPPVLLTFTIGTDPVAL